MRQLPRVMLLLLATVIVIVALLVSALRLAMPHLDNYRSQVLEFVSDVSGANVNASQLKGKWENFGPTLQIRDLNVDMKQTGTLSIARITVALDVWQSLLHWRWQFRDLTFWQLHFNSTQPLLTSDNEKHSFRLTQINDLFLRQFDHFDLRDSTIGFITPSGQHAELAIPKLTWLNEHTRHRAEGEVSLSSFTGQHGVVQVRLDLNDNEGLLNDGRIWMQADDVDMRPWLGRWVRDNTRLDSARFSLAAWVTLRDGDIYAGDLLLSQGGASWQGESGPHTLNVDGLTAHLSRYKNGWVVTVPQTKLSTDGNAWPAGHFSLFWQPQDEQMLGSNSEAEVRVRATQLALDRIAPLVPLFAPLSPALFDNWRALRPRGTIDGLALDIPLAQPEQTRFQVKWRDFSWQYWKLVPGISHLNGEATGSLNDGQAAIAMGQATVPYGDMFQAPLEIKQITGNLNWTQDKQGLTLAGHDLDIQARSLWAHGDFRYQQNSDAQPQLNILAGINVTNAGDAWRYFPTPIMGHSLTHYLSGAIKGGKVSNATLLFNGNPALFPFQHNDGMFQVWVPLRQATYAFQPGWPDLSNLDIDLNFLNDGLWMNAPLAKLGEVDARNVSAVIPDYLKEKLIINGDISGDGQQIGEYFQHTPLKSSLGAALEQLQVKGLTKGHLKLDIPLNGKDVHASGDVQMNNNSLHIKPLNTTMTHLTGQFRYNNGNLESDTLQANWFGQPIDVSFTTQENPDDFGVNVKLQADWQLAKITDIPRQISSQLAGHLPWQGEVNVTLPHKGGAHYAVQLKGDGKEVSSRLPPPLDKKAGESLPVTVNANGDLTHFDLSGSVDERHRFNSRWLLEPTLRVERGIWLNDTKTTPALPDRSGMVLNLPALDGEAWAALLMAGEGGAASPSGEHKVGGATLPGNIILRSPAVSLAGQEWHDVDTTVTQEMGGKTQVKVNAKELRGQLTTSPSAAWQVALDYLYYNPDWQGADGKNTAASPLGQKSDQIDFSKWPAVQFQCAECWLMGQKYGRVSAGLQPKGSTLALTNGLVDTGSSRLNIQGEWVNRPNDQRTSLKGTLQGSNINNATNWFGVNTPLRDAPFKINYDLHWRAAPWQPSAETLSGTLKTHFGKGQITDVDTGAAGQILRLLSFDALLRKLRFDFSDTFKQGFYFDSINGTAWIEDGVIRTDNLSVDGLEADIAMQGNMDLVKRRIDMEAIVTPEISASVGVATAFAINPVVGAAVFAASKVLGPLWSKISVLRYHISGPLDKPKIDEVMRKPRETYNK
ncbi:AsmA2 domain-containing protein [Pantoea stewartii]|uniref:AsmA2 domain-containing protein YhdP n=1 Tax=Pantoea TaxID=53335 RepID=UPI0013DDBDE8|nr:MULTISPECIES: AsmA2 domain-containing protein YhdP [Pantoea]MDF7786676.1 AsmA2 domain-containing protein YhdP [Pantoea stewartii]MEB6535993.1 AsmA2 domain-containing protein YhdP [Pantoea stewartii]QIE97509.1 AsmA2 domain-containing protein [Pantoea stewartii]WRH19611.1 AsmA2 domain-containing protein [Pantoea sp. JZ29]